MTTLQTDREGAIIIVRCPQVRDRNSALAYKNDFARYPGTGKATFPPTRWPVG
jgi:hypothetical protein